MIQAKLNIILQDVYYPKAPVHGYTLNRSIITNAEGHVKKKFVLNIDLENFFASINFGRVRGMFMAKPYALPPEVATVLAQICCYKNALPQGAPSSPIISNMICAKLDKQLTDLSKIHKCHYTRYSDDLTFSTNRSNLFSNVLFIDSIYNIIKSNGFTVNPSKTRLRRRNSRQGVTGLVVNEKVNVDRRFIKKIRAMMHQWKTEGEAALQKTYEEKYNIKSRYPGKEIPAAINVIRGRIEFVGAVRGRTSPMFVYLSGKYNEISSKKIKIPPDPKVKLFKESFWIIEDEEDLIQGTAFFLKDFGLITNAHCVGKKPFIYNPDNAGVKYSVDIAKKHKDVDLVILKPNGMTPKAELLHLDFSSDFAYGREVNLVGYPEYAPGKSISIKNGRVESFTTKSGIERFHISTPIVAGNSGGPVLDRFDRVIGVATSGVKSEKEVAVGGSEPITQEYGVIRLRMLRHLI